MHIDISIISINIFKISLFKVENVGIRNLLIHFASLCVKDIDLGVWLVSTWLSILNIYIFTTCKIYFYLVMNEMLIEIDNHQVTYHNIPTTK